MDKPCIAVPIKNIQSVAAFFVNVGVQDIVSNEQMQQCAESSTQKKGDDTLSYVLSDALAGNGAETNRR